MEIDSVITQNGIENGKFEEDDALDFAADAEDPVERLKRSFYTCDRQDAAEVIDELKALVLTQGDWEACAWISLCYKVGWGVERDAFVAKMLARLCDIKGAEAAEDINKFAEKFARDTEMLLERKRELDKGYQAVQRERNRTYDFFKDYTVIDIETTGLSREADEITELAAVRVRDNKVVDKFQELVRVGRTIPKIVVEKTGITNEMLEGARPIADVLVDFLKFIGDDVLVGYNIDRFDYSFIDRDDVQCFGKHLENGTLDLWPLAKSLLPGLSNYKLDSIREVLGISADGSHRALKDCMDAYAVYSKLACDNPAPEMNVARAENRVPPCGQVLSCEEFRVDIPQGYRPKLKVSIPTHYKDRWEYVKEYPFATFASSNVVVTGDGPSFSRAHAEEVLSALGANVLRAARRDCDFCIVLENPGFNKVDSAQKLEQKGSPIRILDIDDFKKMIKASLDERDED